MRGGGGFSLIASLLKIRKEYIKSKRIYEENIKVFPQLKYPKIEDCEDYRESLRCKTDFPYLLGDMIIREDGSWHKSGYFKIKRQIKKAKQECKEVVIKSLSNNVKNLLYLAHFKNVIRIERVAQIINLHQDYKPIIQTILNNFEYFLSNFSIIERWLKSDEFYKKYKKENHPYPSLINPKTADYRNIPAEFAWEINLPLPENYKFVFLGVHGAGTGAMVEFLRYCNIRLNPIVNFSNFGKYLEMYVGLQSGECNAIVLSSYAEKYNDKLYYLISKKVPYLCLVRDAISLLKPFINHFAYEISPTNKNNKKEEMVKLDFDYRDYLSNFMLYEVCIIEKKNKGDKFHYDRYPKLENLYKYSDGDWHILNYRINLLKHSIDSIYYYDMSSIVGDKTYNTLKEMSKIFGFNVPNNPQLFQSKLNGGDMRMVLPFVLQATLRDLEEYQNLAQEYLQDCVKVLVTTYQAINGKNDYRDLTKIIFGENLFFDNVVCVCEERDYEILQNNTILFDEVKNFLYSYVEQMYKQDKIEKKKKFTEEDILQYLKNNTEVAAKFYRVIEKDLTHIKQHRPDIVASWKYYQEFLKICKEKGIE
ncbi:hypothetical protein B6S12_05745 [Helicobacter valdiviensis]|uniref:DUF2972 domain-containing protein n=1 Tax=Helicobacter valdiviensis TaxID=1458358 RepID=A0A2W6MVR4_9HELI|nr:DUF2972 domain-containing protein [Helicobacter valdiviensis]PZT48051.1 hypothetical protein B6S12_05745 [Helicobacter valdiviensis]